MMTCNTLQHLQKIWLFCLCHAWNSLMPSICLMENFLRCPWWIWNAFTAAVKCRVSTYTQGQMRQTQSKLPDPICSLQFVLEQTEDEGGGGVEGVSVCLSIFSSPLSQRLKHKLTASVLEGSFSHYMCSRRMCHLWRGKDDRKQKWGVYGPAVRGGNSDIGLLGDKQSRRKVSERRPYLNWSWI